MISLLKTLPFKRHINYYLGHILNQLLIIDSVSQIKELFQKPKNLFKGVLCVTVVENNVHCATARGTMPLACS